MKNPALIKFGKEVKKKRIDHDLSREQLADLAGLPFSYIGGIERGDRNPSLEVLAKIAKAFGETEIVIKV